MRLHIRRSDKVSHPNSSYNFVRLEPCQEPVISQWQPGIEYFQLSPLMHLGSRQGVVDFAELVYDTLCHNNQDVDEQELCTFDRAP